MWFYKDDKTKPVLTSEEQVESEWDTHEKLQLPKTAVLLYMKGLDYILEKYDVAKVLKCMSNLQNHW